MIFKVQWNACEVVEKSPFCHLLDMMPSMSITEHPSLAAPVEGSIIPIESRRLAKPHCMMNMSIFIPLSKTYHPTHSLPGYPRPGVQHPWLEPLYCIIFSWEDCHDYDIPSSSYLGEWVDMWIMELDKKARSSLSLLIIVVCSLADIRYPRSKEMIVAGMIPISKSIWSLCLMLILGILIIQKSFPLGIFLNWSSTQSIWFPWAHWLKVLIMQLLGIPIVDPDQLLWAAWCLVHECSGCLQYSSPLVIAFCKSKRMRILCSGYGT